MSQTAIAHSRPAPKHKVGAQVHVVPPEMRTIKFPGDEDIFDPVHGPLEVRGVGMMPEGRPDTFVYALAQNAASNVTYHAPESCIDC